jgi:formylglycine-generating enzyme required for sulfatase activity
MLRKGHHNVRLDDEAWDRLITWIDLNVPDHGSWHEHREIVDDYHEQRLAMRTRFANRPEDPEAVEEASAEPVAFVAPQPLPQRQASAVTVRGWPFDREEAVRRQNAVGLPTAATILLGDDVPIELALVPPGRFAMGNAEGARDESPIAEVVVSRPFYLGTVEVTNRQYGLFDSGHDSAYISMTNKDQNKRGHPVNDPRQPVVRVRWDEARAFCDWLSETTGRTFRLPTEAEWEWACRAGSATDFSYGTAETDFGSHANLADATLERLALKSSPKWHPRDDRFSDGQLVTASVGSFEPNAWGLFDMHGNAAEWTATAYRPYPYDPADSRAAPGPADLVVVRGGSWYDRPKRATSSFRLGYPPWQCVYNVGFRVVMEAE